MVVEVVSGSRNSLLDGHGLKCAIFMSVLFQDFVIPLNHTRLKRNRIYENPRTIHTHSRLTFAVAFAHTTGPDYI